MFNKLRFKRNNFRKFIIYYYTIMKKKNHIINNLY